MGPRHDRLELTDAELRALSELERSLPPSGAAQRPSRRRRLRMAIRRTSLRLAPLRRLAPWLLPVGIVLMVAFVATSVVVSFVGAILAGCGMAAVVDHVARRLRGP